MCLVPLLFSLLLFFLRFLFKIKMGLNPICRGDAEQGLDQKIGNGGMRIAWQFVREDGNAESFFGDHGCEREHPIHAARVTDIQFAIGVAQEPTESVGGKMPGGE